jgi:ribosomal protein S8
MTNGTLTQLFANDTQDMYLKSNIDKYASGDFQLNWNHPTKLTNGIGVIILSTPYGLFTSSSCVKKKIGGIAICHIT